jgi:hypothetical protein
MPQLACKYATAVEGHVVRCGLGRWGGFPSLGVCAACFAGTVTVPGAESMR